MQAWLEREAHVQSRADTDGTDSTRADSRMRPMDIGPYTGPGDVFTQNMLQEIWESEGSASEEQSWQLQDQEPADSSVRESASWEENSGSWDFQSSNTSNTSAYVSSFSYAGYGSSAS